MEEGDTVQLGSPSLYSQRVTRVAQTKKRENQEFELGRDYSQMAQLKRVYPRTLRLPVKAVQRLKRTAQPNPSEDMALHFSL